MHTWSTITIRRDDVAPATSDPAVRRGNIIDIPVATGFDYDGRGFGRELLGGLTQLVLDRLEAGGEAYMLTFMFHPLPPSARAVIMRQAIEAAYSRVVKRVLRYPNSAHNVAEPLLWLGFPDHPVPKHTKTALCDVSINDGLHYHVIVSVPPYTRLRRPFEELVARERDLFRRPGVQRVHCQHISVSHARAIRYGGKSLARGRSTADDIIVLPRSRFEMPLPNQHPSLGRQGQVRRPPPV